MYALDSGQEVPVLLAGWHGVADQFVAAHEGEYDGLEQACPGVEAEPQFAVRPVLLVVERFDPERPVGCVDRILGSTSCLSALP